MPKIGRMFSCFFPETPSAPPLRNAPQRPAVAQTAPAIPAPQPAPTFQPGQQYTAAQLCQFAARRQFTAHTRTALIQRLVQSLSHANLEHLQRIEVLKTLAQTMTGNDAVDYRGASRQSNFFAAYAVDLMFGALANNPGAVMEQELRLVLNLWVNELVPAQQSFNINGIVYSRAEIQEMLNQGRFFPARPQALGQALALGLDQIMRQTARPGQTVHELTVRQAGEAVIQTMRNSIGRTPLLNATQALTWLDAQLGALRCSAQAKALARESLRTLINDQNSDTCWQVPITPREVLCLWATYLQQPQVQSLKGALVESLMVRLVEIRREDPCITGRLQRLLDVGSGIDPNLNAQALQGQLREDLVQIAVKVNEQFNALVEEDAQRAQQDGLRQNEQIASGVGRDLFRHRAVTDMARSKGFGELDLEPELSRLEAGF